MCSVSLMFFLPNFGHLVEACNDVAPLAGSGQLFAPLVSAWNNRLGKNQGFALQVFAKRGPCEARVDFCLLTKYANYLALVHVQLQTALNETLDELNI